MGSAHVGHNGPTYLALAAQAWNPYAFGRLTDCLDPDPHGERISELPPEAIYEICCSFPAEDVEWASDNGLDIQQVFGPDTGPTAWHAGVVNQNPGFLGFLQQRESINDPDFNGHTALFDVVYIEVVCSTGTELAAAKKLIGLAST